MDSALILVIDDDKDILEQVTSVLEAGGFQVICAQNSKEAMVILEVHNPSVVLCDMMMDQVDEGLQMCREFRQKHKETPFFLLSSIANVSTGNFDVMAEGFSGVIQKPITPANLLSLIDQVLGLG